LDIARFQVARAAITAHLDDGGDPIDLEQISIKNARGALRRTIGQATTQLTEMTQAMTAFSDDVLSTRTPRRPPGQPPASAGPAAETRSRALKLLPLGSGNRCRLVPASAATPASSELRSQFPQARIRHFADA
jgi:hypothetical protein